MLTETLIKLFTRDLNVLKTEMNSYKDENTLWVISKDISNSAGNLCLHLVGNLNHYIGATLGDSGYMRQRDLEFSLKDIPKADLMKRINDTIAVVEKTLSKLTEADLQKEYEHRVFGEAMTTAYFLVHLSMHLAFHLGQINYHRRLLD